MSEHVVFIEFQPRFKFHVLDCMIEPICDDSCVHFGVPEGLLKLLHVVYGDDVFDSWSPQP